MLCCGDEEEEVVVDSKPKPPCDDQFFAMIAMAEKARIGIATFPLAELSLQWLLLFRLEEGRNKTRAKQPNASL